MTEHATTSRPRRSARKPITIEDMATRFAVSTKAIRQELGRAGRTGRAPLQPLNPGSDVPVYDLAAADRWWTERRNDQTRYRCGDRDPAARTAHAADTTEWRRALRRAEFGPREHQQLFAHLRAGERLSHAAAHLGTTTHAIYGRARWDDDFADALEAVLADTCPRCVTGTSTRGHCRPCRQAHHQPTHSTTRTPTTPNHREQRTPAG